MLKDFFENRSNRGIKFQFDIPIHFKSGIDGFIRQMRFIYEKPKRALYAPLAFAGKASANHPASNDELHLRFGGTFEA